MIDSKILFYDLETTPLQAWVWGCGEQYVRHQQLVKGRQRHGIICVTYCWNDNKPAKIIDWGYEEQDTGKVVEEFDAIIKTADMTIGKNSDRFDTKMLNTARMFAGLPGMPQWTKYTDDLEKQMRKYFRLPSNALDYISNQLGYGGKIKMELDNWIDIVEKNENGLKAFKKMLKYGKKDVVDTRNLWNQLSEHFEPRWNQANFQGDKIACKYMDCGSTDLYINKTTYNRNNKFYEYHCSVCKRYAGRCNVSDKGTLSKIT